MTLGLATANCISKMFITKELMWIFPKIPGSKNVYQS